MVLNALLYVYNKLARATECLHILYMVTANNRLMQAFRFKVYRLS